MEELEILFVDDEVEILDTVGQYLSQEGFKVTLSDDGLKALGLVKEDKRFDVVFTDLKMPEFDGLELLAAIKEHRPQTEPAGKCKAIGKYHQGSRWCRRR